MNDDDAIDRESSPLWLSYPLSPETPAYGGGDGLQVLPLTAISRGDTANTLLLTLPNHLGTHVDVPIHFFEGAQDLTSYGASDWIFTAPLLVDVETCNGDLVVPEHLPVDLPGDTDLLLIRTGHGENRGKDSYWRSGPGLAPELGLWLRAEFPLIRAVGMDLISVTTRSNRDAGRAAHRAFLDPEGVGSPLLLIEDMALEDCPGKLEWVIVSPLRTVGADGAPVTVWAFTTPPQPSC